MLLELLNREGAHVLLHHPLSHLACKVGRGVPCPDPQAIPWVVCAVWGGRRELDGVVRDLRRPRTAARLAGAAGVGRLPSYRKVMGGALPKRQLGCLRPSRLLWPSAEAAHAQVVWVSKEVRRMTRSQHKGWQSKAVKGGAQARTLSRVQKGSL